ncbi:MAG: hypothetical protein R3F31_05300 [Verrucomicrobiales bacterium]
MKRRHALSLTLGGSAFVALSTTRAADDKKPTPPAPAPVDTSKAPVELKKGDVILFQAIPSPMPVGTGSGKPPRMMRPPSDAAMPD